MKMIDLKLPKRNKDELIKMAEPMKDEGPRYPYGLKLTFEEDEVEKLPRLGKMKVGEKISLSGTGEVTSIRMNEGKDKKKRFSVEIQLHKVGCASKEDYDESFKEATEEK